VRLTCACIALRRWWLARRPAGAGGFTTVVVMGVMTVATIVGTVTLATVDGDNAGVRTDQQYKQAYAAAEAGLHFYAFHLEQDPNYWLACTGVPPVAVGDPSPVNQQWNGQGSDPRIWRTLTGSAAEYTIELLPTAGHSACLPGVTASMLIPNTGAFRVRVTGRIGGSKRSILATFRRAKFLDFLYFTDLETADPLIYSGSSNQTWAAANCLAYWPNRNSSCTRIQFADNDVVAGPLHTNDELLTCDSPQFGRTPADLVESSGPPPGYQKACGTGTPDFQGTWLNPAPPLTMPATNATLSAIAQPGYLFSGRTTIHLEGASMTVTSPVGTSPRTIALPSNGVIYAANAVCGIAGYTVVQSYTNPSGCGDIYISGSTSVPLTVASDNDIIITDDLEATGDAQLGLIANNFVRVYHPVTNRSGSTCTNGAGTPTDLRIDAAMLAIAHSFIVDNYDCGASLGTLTVNGAIAQRFRGPVGTTANTGYIKAYTYDDRFRYMSPPSFLDPVASAWRVIRQTEQVPAR
jgi:hypothetical protein